MVRLDGEDVEAESTHLVGYGYLGIQRVKRQDISHFAAVNLPYWGLIGVGIFSTIYHSTLKYHTQMGKPPSS